MDIVERLRAYLKHENHPDPVFVMRRESPKDWVDAPRFACEFTSAGETIFAWITAEGEGDRIVDSAHRGWPNAYIVRRKPPAE